MDRDMPKEVGFDQVNGATGRNGLTSPIVELELFGVLRIYGIIPDRNR
jgi:hypothetical protein